MPSFSTTSMERLNSCHPSLIQICEQVVLTYDVRVLEGYRSGKRQDELFRQNKSKLRAGESKHNQKPSIAVDLAPYPIDWDNAKRFYLMAGFMFQAAHDLGHTIRWGGDWDSDWVHTDQSFNDLPHFELML